MSDQRSAFRFRVPRLRPSVPPPRSNAPTSQTRERRPPIQPQPLPSSSPPVRPPAPLEPPVIPSPAPPPIQPPAPLDPPVTPSPAPPPILPTQPLDTAVSASAHEPPVEPSTVPEKQDEPRVSAKPPSSSTTSPPASPPVSPSRIASKPVKEIPSLPPSPVVTTTKTIPEEAVPVTDATVSSSSESQTETENTPEVKRSTETNQAIDSNSNENNHEDTFKKQPRMETQKTEAKYHGKHEEAISTTSSIPDTPQTKSMISDTVRVSESLQNPEPITGPQAPHHEETTGQKPVSVITFAGDNRGTSMRIGAGVNKRERVIHIHRRYKVNPDEIIDTMTDGEESSKENKSENDLNSINNQGENAYINCNIQGINNSMVFNCSITEKNPGVHLGSSSDPKNVKKPKMKNTNLTDTKMVKVKITPPEKLTYEPTIRRRCLGGLFMESSDSDPDNPEKPRRHGCRYTGGEKSNKDDKMDNR